MENIAESMINLAKEIQERHTPDEVSLGQAYGVHACPVCGGKVAYHVNVYGKHVGIFCENNKCEVAGFVRIEEDS